jgi:hypothetical protein
LAGFRINPGHDAALWDKKRAAAFAQLAIVGDVSIKQRPRIASSCRAPPHPTHAARGSYEPPSVCPGHFDAVHGVYVLVRFTHDRRLPVLWLFL